MGSSFFEFNIATSGLHTAKAGLELVAHNTANMGTVGYSRQYLKQRAGTPLNSYSGVGQVGSGVSVYGIGRVRDEYLDQKYWPQVSTLGEYSQKSIQLSMMETSFNALSETGLTKNIETFFNSLQDLTVSADSLEYRKAVIEQANTLITQVKNHATMLKEQQEDINDEIAAVVETINGLGDQIANLNEQIYKYEIDGQMANELRDQRTVLLDQLSQYVDIDTKMQKDGTGRELGERLTILINGQEFIGHDTVRKLETVRRTQMQAVPPAVPPIPNPQLHKHDVPGLYNVRFGNGEPLRLTGLKGELKGLIDMRDGDSGKIGQPLATGETTPYKGIPYYIDKLNQFVRTMARAMNEGQRENGNPIDGVKGHKQGFDMNGNKGQALFTYVDANNGENFYMQINGEGIDQIPVPAPPNTQDQPQTDNEVYDEINVFNIQINSNIKEKSSLLAMSDSKEADQKSNNEIIKGFLNLKNDNTLFAEGGAYQFANAISSTLAIDTKQAKSFTAFYKDVAQSVDNQRLQVSSVSLNEEVANMVKYQHLYQVSSKLINVINEVYNTTINGLGV